jgi:hypothetical protein
MSRQADRLVAAIEDHGKGKISAAELTEVYVKSDWGAIGEATERTGGAEARLPKSGR